MKITIVGGGNIGTLMAAEFAAKGNEVIMFTSSPERFDKKISQDFQVFFLFVAVVYLPYN